VIPAQFEYARPASVDEALGILRDNEGGAKVLSGGYSLLPLIKLRLAQPELLVDIRDLPGLDGIGETDDDLRIGGRATHAQIADNDEDAGPHRAGGEVGRVERGAKQNLLSDELGHATGLLVLTGGERAGRGGMGRWEGWASIPPRGQPLSHEDSRPASFPE